MAYTEKEARELVVEAGRRLLAAGLVARTWGNVSARVTGGRFVITPSGMDYTALRPEQLVLVDIESCAYQGHIKPPSERGIHAGAYRLRPEVQFVIHTHQDNASVVGVAGEGLPDLGHARLGGWIPCAAYGLPSTNRLRRAVEAQVAAWPDSPAVLLRRHGALCMGDSMEDAFSVAEALEDACGEHIRLRAEGEPAPAGRVLDYGSSERRGDAFLLTLGGRRQAFWLEDRKLPLAAALHAAVYRSTNAQYVAHEAAPAVVAASREGRALRPMLDDLAQLAGVDVRCVKGEPGEVARAMRGRNAVLLRDAGALCMGAEASDLEALRFLLRKGCAARRFAAAAPGCRPLGRLDALVQRTLFVASYAGKRRLC